MDEKKERTGAGRGKGAGEGGGGRLGLRRGRAWEGGLGWGRDDGGYYNLQSG